MNFKQEFEDKVRRTILDYKLLNKKDKILVALSGGKDSAVVAYLVHKLGYNIEGFTIDLEIGGYSKKNLEVTKELCNNFGVKLNILRLKDRLGYSIGYMRSVLKKKEGLGSCTVCGVVKRYFLNKISKELKADKLVTGHNREDEAEVILMNLFKDYPHLLARQGPGAGLKKHKGFVPRVKPLYFCSEEEIKKYAKLMKLPINHDQCPNRIEAFRLFTDGLLDEEEKKNPKVKENIVQSLVRIMPKLKEKYKNARKINYCKNCGEACKDEQCYTCTLLEKLKN